MFIAQHLSFLGQWPCDRSGCGCECCVARAAAAAFVVLKFPAAVPRSILYQLKGEAARTLSGWSSLLVQAAAVRASERAANERCVPQQRIEPRTHIHIHEVCTSRAATCGEASAFFLFFALNEGLMRPPMKIRSLCTASRMQGQSNLR